VIKWVGAAIDIDDRKRAEEKLRQQAEVLDLAYDAILILDLDGTIEFWNEGAARLYGWAKQEAMEESARSLLRTEFPEPLQEQLTGRVARSKQCFTGGTGHCGFGRKHSSIED